MESMDDMPEDSMQEGIQYQPPQPKEFNPDLAKHTIDTTPLKLSIEGWAGGGRRDEYYEDKIKSKTGREIVKVGVRRIRTGKSLANDAGVAYLYDTVSALVGAAVSSSNFTAQQSYDMYRGRIRNELPWTLIKKIIFCQDCSHTPHLKGTCETPGCKCKKDTSNPYDMKIEGIPEIISNLSAYYLITKKGEAGWWLGKASDQQSTMVLMRHNMGGGGAYPMPQQEKKGWFHNPFAKGVNMASIDFTNDEIKAALDFLSNGKEFLEEGRKEEGLEGQGQRAASQGPAISDAASAYREIQGCSKMKAKIYDKNYKLLKKEGVLKGIYKENHFVYQTGENIIYHIPLLGKLLGALPLIGPMIRPHEVRIMCNFEEILDDNDDYFVEYRKLGDRYEQIPIRHETKENQVNIAQALKEVELSQARFDANVKQPDPTNMMAIAFPIIAILLCRDLFLRSEQHEGDAACRGLNERLAAVGQGLHAPGYQRHQRPDICNPQPNKDPNICFIDTLSGTAPLSINNTQCGPAVI